MEKFTKYSWWLLIVFFLLLALWVYINFNDKLIKLNQEITYTPEWAKQYFNSRVEELVGDTEYKDIIRNYTDKYPKEFLGCEDYLFEPKSESANDLEISRLMEEKKYEEVIAMGDKYLSDSGVWYCDPYFWTQRAKAFLSLNNCLQAEVEAAHAFAIAPSDNGNDEPEKELYFSIHNSSVCKK
ncbi:MAG TPA: hypothetical protein VJH63_03040 [Candidatus Paceibacterota bacterium]